MTTSNASELLTIRIPSKTRSKNDKTGQTHFIISVVEHEWPGLQSVQFNWALDNLPIEAKWILREPS